MITKFNVLTILKDSFKAEFKDNWRAQYRALEFNECLHNAIKKALLTAFDKNIKRFYPTQLNKNDISIIEDCVSFERGKMTNGEDYNKELEKIYSKLNQMYNEHFD